MIFKSLINLIPMKKLRNKLKKDLLKKENEKDSLVVQKRYPKLIKKITKDIKEKNRAIKIIFLVNQNAKFSWISMFRMMQNDKKFDPIMVNIAKDLKDYESNERFFKDLGFEIRSGYNHKTKKYINLKKFSPDVVMYEQFIDTKKKYPISPYHVSKYAITMTCPYSFSIFLDPDSGYNVLNYHSQLFRIYTDSPKNIENFKKYAFMKDKNVTSLGFARFDEYKREIYEVLVPWKYLGKDKKFRIIWAPHWSIGIDKSNKFATATFDENYQFFLDFAKNNPDTEWILKPHPELRAQAIKTKFMSAEEFDNYTKEWENLSNASFYNTGNYFDLFRTSDLMILDSISFIAEYLPANKPSIYLSQNIRDRSIFSELGTKMLDLCYHSYNNTELEELIKSIKNGEDFHKQERQKVINEEIFFYDGTVSENIKNDIENIFN